MNSQLRHPENEQLLRYADGELPARQARKLKAHLESCWECRTELEEMQNVVRESVRYRKEVLEPHLPPPPAPWKDLTAGFDEIDRSIGRRPVWQMLPRPARTWAPIAAAIAVAFVAYYQLRDTPSVEAAALLRKAVAAADAAPVPKPARIRIRTRRQTVIRVAGVKSAETGPIAPLSARSFQQWRDELANKKDEVTTVAGNYQIRTTAPSGDLAEATLQLRATDLHPVQERLQFRNDDWVEIEEIGPETGPAPDIVASTPAMDHTAPATPSTPTNLNEFRQPAPAATVGDELSVLVALHQVGADLGDPIKVKRASGRILVAGVGIDAQRQHEIEQALGSRANVDLRFSEPDAAAPQAEKPVRAETPAGAAVTALQSRIEKQAGGRGHYERLATDVLDASEMMMSRAYALRRIAERFPREVEPEMTAADRQVLQDLYREHAKALAQHAGEIERMLKPVLVPLGGKANVTSAASFPSWQAGTEELFTIARRTETLLAVMLGVAPGEPGGGNLPTQVLSSLAQLRSSSEAYGPAGSTMPRP